MSGKFGPAQPAQERPLDGEARVHDALAAAVVGQGRRAPEGKAEFSHAAFSILTFIDAISKRLARYFSSTLNDIDCCRASYAYR